MVLCILTWSIYEVPLLEDFRGGVLFVEFFYLLNLGFVLVAMMVYIFFDILHHDSWVYTQL